MYFLLRVKNFACGIQSEKFSSSEMLERSKIYLTHPRSNRDAMLHGCGRVLFACALVTFPTRPVFPVFAKGFAFLPKSDRLSRFPKVNNHQVRPFATKHLDMSYIGISDAFDSGNIDFVEYSTEDGPTKLILRIKLDPYTELEEKNHSQYFCFRSTVNGIPEGKAIEVKYVIENANECSYPTAWENYTVFFSPNLNDPNSWERNLNTTYADGEVSWVQTHDRNGSFFFSYFPPYSYERHLNLISKCAAAPDARVTSLGQSLDGRELECISVGHGERVCWIIHRQHPGEHMAEFYAEGLLTRLLGLDTNHIVDGLVKRLLGMYTFYIVPNMNPDGAVAGHLRTNACGSNLNREWAPTGKPGEDDYYEAPTIERSPEVYHVLSKMDETNVDVFLDVHGDEGLPFCFLAGSEGMPNWGPRLKALHGAFLAAYSRANSDMQQAVAYDPEPAGKGRMNLCSNQIAFQYDCLAATLEMPFKDCLSNLDPERGWNPTRSILLGKSVLEPLAHVHPYLRDESEFWKDLSRDDAYIRPSSNYAIQGFSVQL